jgi:hypothetical protein
MNTEKYNSFKEKIAQSIEKQELVKLVLSKKRQRSTTLKNLVVTIVKLKSEFKLNFVYRNLTNDITKNYSFDEGLKLIYQALEKDFFYADLFTTTETYQLLRNKKGNVRLSLTVNGEQKEVSFDHDKSKNRLISIQKNMYLQELGITDKDWKVKKAMISKYKQINKYIEILDPEINKIDFSEDVKIVDMGSGKGYLTFALYDYLQSNLKLNPHILGVEFRQNLVDSSNEIAKKVGFKNLSFEAGTIEGANIEEIAILIALHACDTATDEAIFKGIKADAELIVVAPCCHKQIRKSFEVKDVLSPIGKHGILVERQAEIVTDAIRALMMEAFGYKTKVFEFISTEHTAKNLMIIGRKVKSTIDKVVIFEQIEALKKMYHIDEHYLETLCKKL